MGGGHRFCEAKFGLCPPLHSVFIARYDRLCGRRFILEFGRLLGPTLGRLMRSAATAAGGQLRFKARQAERPLPARLTGPEFVTGALDQHPL